MSELPENRLISRTLLTIDRFKSLPQLQQAVLENDYTPASSKFLRSLLWKTIYITESLNINQWGQALADSRIVYHELLKNEEIPWNLLDSDNVYYKHATMEFIGRKTSIKRRLARIETTNDPLTSDAAAGEPIDLLKTIILDIDRLFPGDEKFNNKQYKFTMIEVLYIWSKHHQIGYKQGFHEIIGLIFMIIKDESISIPSTNTMSMDEKRILNLYDSRYLANDLFIIFNKFMLKTGIVANYYELETQLIASIEHFNKQLIKVDQLIHYNLVSKLKLDTQLWIIRYFRLLLVREINDHDMTNLLWDKLISVNDGDLTDFLNFLIIILLINIKLKLIVCDFTECLSLLLHYPPFTGSEFIQKWSKYSLKLLQCKNDDRKLYELGIKINESFNPDLKISLSFNGRSSEERQRDVRVEKMAFEKFRLEQRLKKKAQLIINNR